MSSNIYIFNKFHYLYIVQKKNLNNLFYQSNLLIPIEWQVILMNEGSLTNIINILQNKKVNIKIIEKKCYKNSKKLIRSIWLEDTLYTKLMFARSIWIFINISHQKYQLLIKKPLGIELIKSKTDIYKNIEEIYYGYSYYLENKFHKYEAIWGRKYTIYYKNQPCITIQEFLSPTIKYLFTKKSKI